VDVLREFVSVVVSDGSRDAGLAMLLLSRPPTNALTRQVYREIVAAADELGRRDDVATVILFGGHEIFSAGDDMPELRTLTPPEADTAARVRREAVDAVAEIPKPTVAAITGYALGAGLTLALAADWRVCGDNVKFGATEILAGLIPGGGGMARLARVAGASRAKELVFSGRYFDAEEALTLSLVDEMVAPDDVYDAAAAWARRFLDGPPHALAAAKAAINDACEDAADPERAERLAAERRRYVEVFAAAHGGALPDCPPRPRERAVPPPRAADRPAPSAGDVPDPDAG
jgi:enoyl-CoA hydratase